ncbi:hypothetical protein TNCV_1625731 [Trichonephila clavipes]|nr:hypothetical protein TNCV_1625731 [Trichonephila clavipes]
MYRNVRHRRNVYRPSDPPALISKAELLTDKLDVLYSKLLAKLPDLMNHRGTILYHNNTRPHAAVMTHQMIMGFAWECLLTWQQHVSCFEQFIQSENL